MSIPARRMLREHIRMQHIDDLHAGVPLSTECG
jgi:hypothetical protein